MWGEGADCLLRGDTGNGNGNAVMRESGGGKKPKNWSIRLECRNDWGRLWAASIREGKKKTENL